MLIEYCSVSLVKYLTSMEKHTESRSPTSPMVIPPYETLSVITSVLCALEALHTLQPTPLAHRDIKAENILLGSDNKWKLCDFGSVSSFDGILSSSGSQASKEQMLIDRTTTPNYRPPELWDIELSKMRIGTKVDMWMLGCLLYRICFGRMPFNDAKLQILHGKFSIPPPFDQLLQDTSLQNKFVDIAFLLGLLNKLLVVEPSIRIGSVEASKICKEKLQSMQSQQQRDTPTNPRVSNATVPTNRLSKTSFLDSNDSTETTFEDNSNNHNNAHSKIKLPKVKLGRMLGRLSGTSAAQVALTDAEAYEFNQSKVSGNENEVEIDDAKRELKDSYSSDSKEMIQQLMIEREILEAKITKLEEIVLKQKYIIKQQAEIIQTSSNSQAIIEEKMQTSNLNPEVEFGWATGWNSPSTTSTKVQTPVHQSPAQISSADQLPMYNRSDSSTLPPAFQSERSLLEVEDGHLAAESTAPSGGKLESDAEISGKHVKQEFLHSNSVDNFDQTESFLQVQDEQRSTTPQSVLLKPSAAAAADYDEKSSDSSSDGGFDASTNFSISMQDIDTNNTMPSHSPSRTAGDVPVEEPRQFIEEYNNFDDDSSLLTSLTQPSIVTGSTAGKRDLMTHEEQSESPTRQLIDLNYEESQDNLPTISSRNPFNSSSASSELEDIITGGVEKNGHHDEDSTQLQSLIDRSLSHGRSFSSDAFGLDSLVLGHSDTNERGDYETLSNSSKLIHQRSQTMTDIDLATDKIPLSSGEGEDWSCIAL